MLRGPAVQDMKIYINTDSVRNSRLSVPSPRDTLMVNSQRSSFQSMSHGPSLPMR